MAAKSRGFHVTDFENDTSFWEKISQTQKVSYCIAGQEVCPDSKRPHLQCYIHFASPRSLKAIIKLMTPRHTEAARANALTGYNYCSKDGNIAFEFGIRPSQGLRTDLLNIQKDILDGASYENIADKNFPTWVRYRHAIKEYASMKEPKRNWVPEVHIIWGDPDTSKTRTAVEAGASGVYFRAGGFIDGYEGEDVVLFDEFDPSQCERETMLQLLDRYNFRINTKGGSRNWKPRVIYICSNLNPENWYNGCKAFKRRITSIKHMTQNGTQVP